MSLSAMRPTLPPVSAEQQIGVVELIPTELKPFAHLGGVWVHGPW